MKRVRKRTKSMTNAPEIADRLMRTCSNDHSHVKFEGGNRTRKSEVYPGELCNQLIAGLKQQMRDDGRWMSSVTVCSVDEDKCDQDTITAICTECSIPARAVFCMSPTESRSLEN